MNIKKIILLLFVLIACDTYAQIVLPINENLTDEFWSILKTTYPDLNLERREIEKDFNFYEEAVIRDLLEDKIVRQNDMIKDVGLYTFALRCTHPQIWHNFVKYNDDVYVLEETYDDNSIIKQTEYLISIFKNNPDIPKKYFPVFLKHIISTSEMNRSHIDF